ncbi:hypothetical protein HUU05_14220 [candidate division KSB1 bacterium]|nr:hypothetical protein [candidate division KSB1 bacterium]
MPRFTRKNSRRFLVLAAGFGLVSGLWIWTLYDDQAWLEAYVVRNLREHFGENVRYDSLHVHFRGVDLYDVEYRPVERAAQRFLVAADEITVRFGYWDLFRHLLRSQPHVLRLRILNPTLSLSKASLLHAANDTTPAQFSSATLATADSSWRQFARQYHIVETIELNHGRIVLQESATAQNNGGAEVEVLREINGWVRTLGDWKAQLKIHGQLAHWENSELALATEIDLRYLALDSLVLKVEDWRHRGPLPIPGPGNLEMTNGSLRGRISFARTSQSGVRLQGDLALQNGQLLWWPDSAKRARRAAPPASNNFLGQTLLSLRSAPVRVDSLYLNARIADGWLLLDSCRQFLNDQPVRLAGRVNVMPLPLFRTLQEIAQRALPATAAPAQDSLPPPPIPALAEQEIDLKLSCDSLALAELLAPFLSNENGKDAVPISGAWQLSANLYGALRAPRLYLKLANRNGSIYGRRIHHLESEFWYAPQRNDSLRHVIPNHEVRWQGNGAFEVAFLKLGRSEAAPSLEWEGWGKIDCGAAELPLDLTLLTHGTLALPAISFLPAASDAVLHAAGSPQLRISTRAQITGALLQPHLVGELQCDLGSAENPLRWLGNFALQKDTLHVRAHRPDLASQVEAQIWRWGKQPLFRVQGLETELLSTWFGEEWTRSISTDVDFDFALAGHPDSLTLQINAKKKASGAKWFQLNGYMLPLVKDERVISGTMQFFPGRANSFTANYICHVQDSTITISDLHCENWLSGNLQLHTRSARRGELQGNFRLLDADLSRLTDARRQDQPRYRGRLFGEMKLHGTLNEPLGQGNFWLYDGFFNDVGNFSVRGEVNLDSTAWQLPSLKIEKDRKPYLNAKVDYLRSAQNLHLELQGAGIKSDEFLQALADVPNGKFHGLLSFDLKAQGLLTDFLNTTGIPLSGKILVRDGAVRWFNFDELEAQLQSVSAGSKPATLSRYGMRLPHITYRKQNAFALEASGFLPFDDANDLDIVAQGEGNFLALLPEITTYFKSAESTGKLRLHLLGPYKKLRLPNSHLSFFAERLELTRIAPQIKALRGELATDERGTFIDVRQMHGTIGDASLTIRNEEQVPPLPMTTAENLLQKSASIYPDSLLPRPLRLSDSQIYLGALFLQSSKNGLPLNIPGLMQKHEVGRFWITGLMDSTTMYGDADEFIICGPWAHPVLSGGLVLENVNFQFPFEENTETDSALAKLLLNLNWNVLAKSRRDNRYVISIPSAVDEVFVSLGLDDADSRLKLQGVLADSSFFTEGKITSHRGVVEYLDMSFQVENCGAEFDRSDWRPIVYGRGHTVITDSTNFPYNVYLTLYTVDSTSGQEVPRGRFQNAYFKLSSDHPSFLGDTQEQLLATLGYSVDRLGQNAKDAMGIGTDHLIIRPFLRPVERALERKLGLDVVRFSSRFTRNLLTSDGEPNGATPGNAIVAGRPSLFRNSRLTLGKHLSNSLYLLYVGQVETGLVESELAEATNDKIANLYYNLQLRHRLGLEYRLNPSMLLQFEYDYNPLLLKDKADPRIWLRHSFPVEFPLPEGK